MKKKILAVLLAASMIGSAFSFSAFAEDHTDETVTSYLTGKEVPYEIGRSRPIAVMFNNIQDAVPQYGIDHADVKVEAEVEGLITRIMGIMEDYDGIDRIGSVRSARNYYYYFARAFEAIYVHFGEAAYAIPLLRLNETNELEGLSDYGDIVYYRSDDRPSPHNVFFTYESIQKGIEHTGISKYLPSYYGGNFHFADAENENKLENGVVANVVMPGYSYNHARFDYNEEDGLYYRSQYHDAQVEGNTGAQLTTKNIILQYCDSVPFDDNGYLWTDVTTSGTGKFITNGRCIDITWEKAGNKEDSIHYTDIVAPNVTVPVYGADFNNTNYYDADGNIIDINPGQTWICLIRNQAANKVIITDDRSIDTDAIDYME